MSVGPALEGPDEEVADPEVADTRTVTATTRATKAPRRAPVRVNLDAGTSLLRPMRVHVLSRCRRLLATDPATGGHVWHTDVTPLSLRRKGRAPPRSRQDLVRGRSRARGSGTTPSSRRVITMSAVDAQHRTSYPHIWPVDEQRRTSYSHIGPLLASSKSDISAAGPAVAHRCVVAVPLLRWEKQGHSGGPLGTAGDELCRPARAFPVGGRRARKVLW